MSGVCVRSSWPQRSSKTSRSSPPPECWEVEGLLGIWEHAPRTWFCIDPLGSCEWCWWFVTSHEKRSQNKTTPWQSYGSMSSLHHVDASVQKPSSSILGVVSRLVSECVRNDSSTASWVFHTFLCTLLFSKMLVPGRTCQQGIVPLPSCISGISGITDLKHEVHPRWEVKQPLATLHVSMQWWFETCKILQYPTIFNNDYN